jgi:SAM-dependent methyltransferase
VNHDTFSERVFRAPAGRTQRFAELALRYIPGQPALRLLDIGSGTGEELAHLLEMLPESSGVGVDISAPNIALAVKTWGALADRLQFHAADYLDFEDGIFDVIISDSTLQLIPVASERLVAKIAQDMKIGGLLICGVPYDCAYNHLLWTVRRFFRLVRSQATDHFIYRIGRLVAGNKMTPELLRDRIHYMYLLPYCIFGSKKLDAILDDCGLECLAEIPIPWASLAQPRHRLYVYRKAAPRGGDPIRG